MIKQKDVTEAKQMNYVVVDKENIDREHLCCAISDKKGGALLKKAWLQERFDDGLVFLKAEVQGKCFIEYLPAERAFCPVEGENCMFINCLWVSGKYQGHGYARELLERCIKDSREKNKKGLMILSSKKKKPYLADQAFLRHMGFILADQCDPYFELMFLPFEKTYQLPRFKQNQPVPSSGFVLYYTHQCPFAAIYVPLLKDAASHYHIDFQAIQLTEARQAQASPAIFSTFSLFYQGRLITHEIMNVKRFEKIIAQCLAQS